MNRLIVSLVIICLPTVSALATVLRVPSQYSTIQAGIDASSWGDTVLVADGTYTGAGNREIQCFGMRIVIMSENGPETCVIDCQGVGRAFNFIGREQRDTILKGFTITNGYVGSNRGGGILCANSSPSIVECILCYNRTTGTGLRGAGISVQRGTPLIQNCTFYQNRADNGDNGWGGGICSDTSNMVVNSCILYDNWGSS